ncbi:hypothetical protein Gotur_008983, partial [Gossypium turneri]
MKPMPMEFVTDPEEPRFSHGSRRWFSANMALMVALGNLASLIAAGNVPSCQSENHVNSKRWKQLIQSRGCSFIFSTATPVPIATAGHGKIQHYFSVTYSFCYYPYYCTSRF